MHVATRLMIVLVATVLVIVAGYMLVSHNQRQSMLRMALVQNTETLGRALQAGLTHALRTGSVAGTEEIVAAAIADRAVVAGVVLDASGQVLAGRAEDLACLRRHIPDPVVASASSGWGACGGELYWTAMPLPEPAFQLVVAQRGLVLERAVAEALRRQLFLMLALLLAIAAALPILLDGMLISPLREIRHGLQRLGEEGKMPRIEVPHGAGELAHLAEAINTMAAQLEEKRRELIERGEEKVALEQRLRESEKFAVMGRLSGGLAHELGTPLSVIGIRAQAIQFAPNTLPASRDHAAVIESQVRRLTDFIHGLLHMARERGIVFDTVDLDELMRELKEEVAPRASAQNVDLVIEWPVQPVHLRGQKTLLRHALRNLVRNSLHALADQQGDLRIHVRAEVDEHEVRIFVEDSGPGIPPEDLSRVFEPFYTTKCVGKGMGLGLPITRAIIEEHGGELHLANLTTRGVRATMVLPVAPPAAHTEYSYDSTTATAAFPRGESSNVA
jgi:two-component system, NtrC family, sensor kinase